MRNLTSKRLGIPNGRWPWSGLFLLCLATLSLFSPWISNDKPILIVVDHRVFFPATLTYHPHEFQQVEFGKIDYRTLEEKLRHSGANPFFLWPPVRYGPNESLTELPSSPPTSPSLAHLLGTDDRGRDCLARLLYGYRNSLFFGLIVGFLGCFFGYLIGALQGFMGGRVDLILQRVIEIWEAQPFLFVLLFFISVFPQRNFVFLILVYSIFAWTPVSSYVRAECLKVRRQEFIAATKNLGASPVRIVLRHLFPNSLTAVLTFSPFLIAHGITLLAALDFLGLGLPPPEASLGEMFQQARHHIDCWWLIVFPFMLLSLTVLFLHFSGRNLRAHLDPRSPQTIT